MAVVARLAAASVVALWAVDSAAELASEAEVVEDSMVEAAMEEGAGKLRAN
jgi:hypothetical protein